MQLDNLAKGFEIIQFRIPKLRPIASFVLQDGTIDRHDFQIDTCLIDSYKKEHFDIRVFLSWRLNFKPDVYNCVILSVAPDDFIPEFERMQRGRADD